ncbi:1-acyl-sn-glycerol-3-phosphate acyltransferase, partial [Sphingomonas sp. HMWF008]
MPISPQARAAAAAGTPPPLSWIAFARLWTRIALLALLLILLVPPHYLWRILHIS